MQSSSRISGLALLVLIGTLVFFASTSGPASATDGGTSDVPPILPLITPAEGTPAAVTRSDALPPLAGYGPVVAALPGLVGFNAPVHAPPGAPLALAVPVAPSSPGLVLPATEVSASAPTTPASRGQAVVARLNFDLSSIGYTISFHPYAGTHLGLTFTQRRHIEVYVRPGAPDSQLAYIVAHEIGHAVDHIRNTGQDRADWKAARGISASTPWWPTDIGSDLAIPAGDFAECFASFATGSPSHSVWGDCDPALGLMQRLAYH